jgi:hypothetical protein
MKQIPLTKGRMALIDDEDYGSLIEFKWHMNSSGYAFRYAFDENGKRRCILMHRQILGLTSQDKVEVDHKSEVRTDNQKANLRICTRSQNMMNRGPQANNACGYKGVHKQRKKWKAMIMINQKRKYLGVYDTPELAYQAYCKAAAEIHGEFANFKHRAIAAKPVEGEK